MINLGVWFSNIYWDLKVNSLLGVKRQMEAQLMKGGMGLDFADFSIKQRIFSPYPIII